LSTLADSARQSTTPQPSLTRPPVLSTTCSTPLGSTWAARARSRLRIEGAMARSVADYRHGDGYAVPILAILGSGVRP
jgi:hypothetical protein